MKIDNTSMFFNASIEGGTATAAWATSVGQSKNNGYRFNNTIPGLVNFIIGLNYKIYTLSKNEDLDITKGSATRELLYFSLFDKVFVNNNRVENTNFIILLVKEHSKSHDGRILISYPNYARITKDKKTLYSNQYAINKMAETINCSNGCWFVHNLTIKNQDELHFSAVVVDVEPKIYSKSQIRKKEWDLLVDDFNTIDVLPNQEDFDISSFLDACKSTGLVYTDKLITRFVSSLLTKPFVILTGLSGSGKTKLAQAYVQWICQEESQYRIIPVGADWTNREPLLGYPNALKPEEYVKPDSGVIDLIIQANSNPELPHFLILDEMNLSHVERYFADFLSVMESNEEIPLYAEGIVDNGVPSKLKVPANLFIIGTVNIDETTNMFSPKVLDRANTIEFRINNNEMKGFLGTASDLNMKALLGKGANMAQNFIDLSSNKSFTNKDRDEINKTLLNFFGELQKTGAEFGYRSATEILRLINQLDTLNNEITTSEKIDFAIMQKLLPKLHGSRRKLSPILETLGSFCLTEDLKVVKDVFDKNDFDYSNDKVLYPLSLEKIARMYKGAIDNGFASYAEA